MSGIAHVVKQFFLMSLMVIFCHQFALASPAVLERLPDAEALQNEIDLLSQQGDNPNQKARIDILQATLVALHQAQQFQARSEALIQQSQRLPDDIADAKAKLAKLRNKRSTSLLDNRSISWLEGEFTQYRTQRTRLDAKIQGLTEQLHLLERRPSQIADQQQQNLEEADELTRTPHLSGGQDFLHDRIAMVRAKQSRNQAQREYLDHERGLLLGQIELTGILVQIAQQEFSIAWKHERAVAKAIARLRRAEAEKLVAQVSASQGEAHSWLVAELKYNLSLAQTLQNTAEKIDQIGVQHLQLQETLAFVNEVLETTQQQLKLVSINPKLGRLMRRQEEVMPEIKADRHLDEMIADAQYQLLRHGKENVQIKDTASYVQSKQADNVLGKVSEQDRKRLADILQSRRTLLENLQDSQRALLEAAFDVQGIESELLHQKQVFAQVISEEMVWVPSSEPLSISSLSQIPLALSNMLNRENMGLVANSFLYGVSRKPLSMVFGGVFLLGLILAQPYLRRQEAHLTGKVGNVRQDGYFVSIKTLAFVMLRTLPIPFGLFMTGIFIHKGADTAFELGLSDALMQVSLAIYLLRITQVKSTLTGISREHFSVNANRLLSRQRFIIRFVYPLVALYFLIVWVSGYRQNEVVDAIGVPLLIIFGVLVSYSAVVAYQKKIFIFLGELGNKLLYFTAIVIPIGFASVAAFGFFETGVLVAQHYLITLLGYAVLWTCYQILNRSLLVLERRNAYRDAIERRRQMLLARAENSEEEESEKPDEDILINIHTVQAHLSALLSLGIVFALVGFFWLVWADLLPALSRLEAYPLWTISDGDGEVSAVTLASLLKGVWLIILAIVIYRYLASMLQLILVRLTGMSASTAFVITQTIRYVVVMLTLFMILGIVGVRWGEIQWLVAALGVGIGIGLQEIIANFFSGLIILYERPFRLGDTVTLASTTGTVTDIRIRSTTITDWDKKEIIIPNKLFITDQLVNWTLSSSVTRVVMTFNIDSRVDSEKVLQLMLDEASVHPGVLSEPEPEAFLMSMDAGLQRYELRVYVPEMGNRLPVLTSMNKAMNLRFQKEGITLSAPQYEVHLKKN